MSRLSTVQRFTLHTALTPNAAKQRLSDVLDAQHSLFAKPAYPFYGTIKGEHFQLTRVSKARRRLWGVEITGDIHDVATGSTITITLQPRKDAAAVWLAFMVIGALISFRFLLAALTDQIPLGLGLFPAGILLAVLLFGYAIGPDDPEIGLAQIQLRDLFEAHTVSAGS